MRIAEIYRSRQGEGRYTGRDSVFVRTSGCNLRCSFCDTPYTSWYPEGDDLSIEQIVQRIESFATNNVVLTGGEPMLFAELIPLTAQLRSIGCHITVETAGTLYLPVVCDLMSISPKMSNSAPDADGDPRWRLRHELTRRAPEVIRQLTAEYDCQFKFVMGHPDDIPEVLAYLAEHPQIDHSHVWLMPEGTTIERLSEVGEWLVQVCEDYNFKFCPRKHIEWYGHSRAS